MVTLEEVVNVGPVRDQHAVPAQLLLHPAAQQNGVGVGGNAVDGGRVHHGGEGAGAEALQEGSEELLAEIVLCNDGRGAVLAGNRNAVTHEVLDGDGGILQADMIGVGALDGQGFLAGHLGLQVGIFTEALPDARPAGVAAQVHHRGEHPRHLGGTGLISHGTAHQAGIFPVEGGRQVYFLRIERTVREVRGTVNHVQAIDAGNADGFHALFLNLAHHGGRLLARMGGVVHHIEDGAHLILADNLVQLGRIDGLAGLVFQYGNVKLDQLAGLFFQGHPLEDLFHLGFYRLVCRDCLTAVVGGTGGKKGCR